MSPMMLGWICWLEFWAVWFRPEVRRTAAVVSLDDWRRDHPARRSA